MTRDREKGRNAMKLIPEKSYYRNFNKKNKEIKRKVNNKKRR